jgi:hypothetical protein
VHPLLSIPARVFSAHPSKPVHNFVSEDIASFLRFLSESASEDIVILL